MIAKKTHTDHARELAARIDLVPAFTDIYSGPEEEALVREFIEDRICEDVQHELRTFLASEESDIDQLRAALPESLRAKYSSVMSHRDTILWIKQEIAYAIGIEVGRRLAGLAR